nr:hypothetical protein [Variovorax boronicumulans]
MADEKPIPERRLIERALRDAGLSRVHAKRFISAGWPALVDARRAEADELRSQLEELRETLEGEKMDTVSPAA